MKFNSVSTYNIEAIIGRSEMKQFLKYNNHSDLIWISFTDPNKNFLYQSCTFKDTLKLRFWDVDEDICGYKKASKEDLDKIYNFILKYRNEKFIINCEAGQSRSSAVGLFIEYINRYMFIYDKWEHFPSKILQHERYIPNMYIFNELRNRYDKENK